MLVMFGFLPFISKINCTAVQLFVFFLSHSGVAERVFLAVSELFCPRKLALCLVRITKEQKRITCTLKEYYLSIKP